MRNPKKKMFSLWSLLGLLAVLLICPPVWAETLPLLPMLQIGVEQADNPEQVSILLQILFLLTVLSLAMP